MRTVQQISLLVVAALLGLAVPAAHAEEPASMSCGLVEENTIHVDGLTSDWDGVSVVTLKVDPAPGASPRTLSVRVRCNYDQKSLYWLIEVDDDILLRTGGGGGNEDHIEFAFGVEKKKSGELRIDKLSIYPGAAAQKQKRLVRWQAQKPPKVIDGEGPAGRKKPAKGGAFEVWDALQPRGYAVEMRMPKSSIPGYVEGTPLRLSLRVADSDAPSGQLAASAQLGSLDRAEALAAIELEQAGMSMTDILGDLKAKESDVYLDKSGDIGEGPGRILMVGRFLAFASKTFAYQEVAPSRADIREAQLIELENKKLAMALRIAERGGGGLREVLRVYVLKGNRFESIFATEVAKEQGGRRLNTQILFPRRGSSTDIVLTPQPPVGFSAANYADLPAEDVIPILLPWQDKKTKYVYKGGQYVKE
jgi:hypothetical protein